MVQAFVITLREGLEAFLIVAISLAYLRKTGRTNLTAAVHWGIAIAIAISVGSGSLSNSETGTDTTAVSGSRKTGRGTTGLVGGSSLARAGDGGGPDATTVAASESSAPRRGGSQNVP